MRGYIPEDEDSPFMLAVYAWLDAHYTTDEMADYVMECMNDLDEKFELIKKQ